MSYVITSKSNFGESVLTKEKSLLNIELKARDNCEEVKFFASLEDAQDMLENITLLSNFSTSDFFVKEAKKYGSKLILKRTVYTQSYKETQTLIDNFINNHKKI